MFHYGLPFVVNSYTEVGGNTSPNFCAVLFFFILSLTNLMKIQVGLLPGP